MTRSTFAFDDLCPECLGFMPSHQRKLVLLVDGYAMPRREPRIVRLAKKNIDRAFRDYIGQGIEDESIRPCDVKLSAFAIAGALNWIGHVFGRQGASEFIGVLELSIALLIVSLPSQPAGPDMTVRRCGINASLISQVAESHK